MFINQDGYTCLPYLEVDNNNSTSMREFSLDINILLQLCGAKLDHSVVGVCISGVYIHIPMVIFERSSPLTTANMYVKPFT